MSGVSRRLVCHAAFASIAGWSTIPAAAGAPFPAAFTPAHFDVGPVRVSERHPLHTSLTRVEIAADGVISVRVRAFSDDFSAAVGRATGSRVEPNHVVADDAAERYVGASLRLTLGGSPVALKLLSQRRDGDVTWLELRGTGKGSLRGALIESRLLMDFHADQVNIVQASYEGRSHTMLFSPGEKAKRLPYEGPPGDSTTGTTAGVPDQRVAEACRNQPDGVISTIDISPFD